MYISSVVPVCVLCIVFCTVVLCVMYVAVSEGLQMKMSSESYNLVQVIFSFEINAPVHGPCTIN